MSVAISDQPSHTPSHSMRDIRHRYLHLVKPLLGLRQILRIRIPISNQSANTTTTALSLSGMSTHGTLASIAILPATPLLSSNPSAGGSSRECGCGTVERTKLSPKRKNQRRSPVSGSLVSIPSPRLRAKVKSAWWFVLKDRVQSAGRMKGLYVSEAKDEAACCSSSGKDAGVDALLCVSIVLLVAGESPTYALQCACCSICSR